MPADDLFGRAKAAMTGTNKLATVSRLDSSVEDQVSPRNKLLFDSGWRFHLGDADESAKDFCWGADKPESAEVAERSEFNALCLVSCSVDWAKRIDPRGSRYRRSSYR